MNNIALIGRVGRDPEIKTISTNGGDKLIAETSLAAHRPAKEKDKQTVWFNIKAFGKRRAARAICQKVTSWA